MHRAAALPLRAAARPAACTCLCPGPGWKLGVSEAYTQRPEGGKSWLRERARKGRRSEDSKVAPTGGTRPCSRRLAPRPAAGSGAHAPENRRDGGTRSRVIGGRRTLTVNHCVPRGAREARGSTEAASKGEQARGAPPACSARLAACVFEKLGGEGPPTAMKTQHLVPFQTCRPKFVVAPQAQSEGRPTGGPGRDKASATAASRLCWPAWRRGAGSQARRAPAV
jgi:hypothetical protein